MGTAVLEMVHDDKDVITLIPTSDMTAYKIKPHCSSRDYSTPFSSTDYYKEVDETLTFFSL